MRHLPCLNDLGSLGMASRGAKALSTRGDFDTAMGSSELVVIEFFASWCGPCRIIGPYFQELAAEFTSVNFYRVDVDQLAEVAKDEEILAMPTFKFYRNGRTLPGGVLKGSSKDALRSKLESLMQS